MLSVVAGLAVVFGLAAWMIRMTARSNRFGQLANRHAQAYYLHRGKIESYPALAEPLEKAGVPPAGIEKFLGGIDREVRLRDYHAAMKAKYERLACYPWLSETPDPQEPE